MDRPPSRPVPRPSGARARAGPPCRRRAGGASGGRIHGPPLYGDADGNKSVNAADFALFTESFGAAAGAASYNPAFNSDGNGRIDSLDFAQFRKRFGTALSY